MFTGIIECIGTVIEKKIQDTNITFTIQSNISSSLKIDQSVSHNGVCLTVVQADNNQHQVTAIHETLQLTHLKYWEIGQKVNLERAMISGQRLDGHIVQGHIDGVSEVKSILPQNGSFIFTFSLPEAQQNFIVKKGSVCIDGVSLTVANDEVLFFQTAIIPYTYENTIFKYYKVGSIVNIEFDIFGKYFEKYFKNMAEEKMKPL